MSTVLSMRQRCALDEDGKDGNAALQGRPDLRRHPIAGILEAAATFGIGRRHPIATDEDDHGVGRRQVPFDDMAEISPALDALDVAEQAFRPKYSPRVSLDRRAMPRASARR